MPGGYVSPGILGASTVIGAGSVVSGSIASGIVGAVHLANGAVQSGGISSGSVSAIHMASGSVVNVLSQFGSAFAVRSLTDQTATNSGNIISVSGPGLYRVSTYAVVTQGGLLNAGNLTARLDWTDDTQAQNTSPITGVALITSGAFGLGNSMFRSVSGQPIIFTVTLGALTGSPHYNAYAAVERVN